MRALVVVCAGAGCMVPPQPSAQPQPQPTPWGTTAAGGSTRTETPSIAPASGLPAGRWVSTEWASVTNPAMVSADFYLAITIADDGRFAGSWARYICLTQAYGIISCSLGPIEGDASGQLAADGGGSIELERLGGSQLTWSTKSASEIAIELPASWQGDRVLFRSSIKR